MLHNALTKDGKSTPFQRRHYQHSLRLANGVCQIDSIKIIGSFGRRSQNTKFFIGIVFFSSPEQFFITLTNPSYLAGVWSKDSTPPRQGLHSIVQVMSTLKISVADSYTDIQDLFCDTKCVLFLETLCSSINKLLQSECCSVCTSA